MDEINIMVSVLIPAYNTERFLKQSLNSIVNQTYQNLQVVVVDDGSQDNTLSIAQQFAEEYSFVEVYHQVNSGVAAARNKLIAHAKGDYILFVDSDDWIESNMIEQMIEDLKKTHSDIVVCGYVKNKNQQEIICPVTNKNFIISGSENVIKSLLYHKELNGSLCNKLVPRKFYEGLSFRKDIWYGEDCLFFWQALNKGVERICLINDCYYHYRMNENSISHESFNYKKMSGHEVWRQINEDVQAKWPSLSKLGYAAYAISDMWLLFFASRENYPIDDNLRLYQKNVREHLLEIFSSGIISKKKCFFAVIIAFSYRLSSKLIQTLKN